MEIAYAIILFFLPLPLIILATCAPYPSLIVSGLLVLGICKWWSIREAMFFVLGIALFSCVSGVLMHRSFPDARVIVIAVILGVAGMGLFFMTAGGDYAGWWKENFNEAMQTSLAQYKKQGIEEEKQVARIEATAKSIERIFIFGFPAIIVIGATSFVSVNWFFARALLRRMGRRHTPLLPLHKWKIPEVFIWVFIGAFFVMLAGKVSSIDFFYRIGLNFIILTFVAYAGQGVILVDFFLKRLRWPTFIRGLVYALFLIQPVFLVLIFLLGMFDIWFNFRKLEAKG